MNRPATLTAVAVVLAAAFLAGSLPALAGDPVPILDQNKPQEGTTHNFYVRTFYDKDADYKHDPGESFQSGDPIDRETRPDKSCWMATAWNLLEHAGYGNEYYAYCLQGGAPKASPDPWTGAACYADSVKSTADPNANNAFTVDDGGFPIWATTQKGVAAAGYIQTTTESSHKWSQDPVAWCDGHLESGRPVGITWWAGVWVPGARPSSPYADKPTEGYHAITIWSIDAEHSKMTITDSDDKTPGARQVTYTLTALTGADAGKWAWHFIDTEYNKTCKVNSALVLTYPTPVERTSWGRIKAMYK